jgi:hypothetical protein
VRCASHNSPAKRREEIGFVSIKVESKVTIYEKDGEEPSGLELPTLSVVSHWTAHNWVVIEVDNRKYTVDVTDLGDAIANATRTGSR